MFGWARAILTEPARAQSQQGHSRGLSSNDARDPADRSRSTRFLNMTGEVAVDTAAEAAAEETATIQVVKGPRNLCLDYHLRHLLAILVTTMVQAMSKTMTTSTPTTREIVTGRRC